MYQTTHDLGLRKKVLAIGRYMHQNELIETIQGR